MKEDYVIGHNNRANDLEWWAGTQRRNTPWIDLLLRKFSHTAPAVAPAFPGGPGHKAQGEAGATLPSRSQSATLTVRRIKQMSTVVAAPEQRTVLRTVSWETFERLLADHLDAPAPRLTFDHGVLEIMSPSLEHEEWKEVLTSLVEILAEEMNLDTLNIGSTTFRREEFERGFEADACFYVQNAERMRGKRRIEVSDPGPDLVIEVEITNPALNKLPIYADFAVPEVWRHDGTRLVILELSRGNYVERSHSLVFPMASADDLSRLAAQGLSLRRREWLAVVRQWIRVQNP